MTELEETQAKYIKELEGKIQKPLPVHADQCLCPKCLDLKPHGGILYVDWPEIKQRKRW